MHADTDFFLTPNNISDIYILLTVLKKTVIGYIMSLYICVLHSNSVDICPFASITCDNRLDYIYFVFFW